MASSRPSRRNAGRSETLQRVKRTAVDICESRETTRRFWPGTVPEPAAEGEDEGSSATAQSLEFALEAHLRDFLAKNLDRIETGLRLYASPERNGVEYPVGGGRIDLLAVDRNGKFVVIELKLSQGRKKTLGQLLYYM